MRSSYQILKEMRDIKHNARSKDMQDYFATFFKEHDYTRYGREDLPSSFFVYSSNVDGLFAKSGIPRIYVVDAELTIRSVFTDNPLAGYDELEAAINDASSR